jgi:hypothetical protein
MSFVDIRPSPERIEMSRQSDSRLLDDQFLTLVARAERFATLFCQRARTSVDGHLGEAEWGERNAWLERLASGSLTPHGLIAGIVLADRGATGPRWGALAETEIGLGVAFLDTMRDIMGDGFTEQARDAWSRVIVDVADLLDDGCPDAPS